MLETDQAWEVFEELEDCYFNAERANNPPRYQPEAQEPLTAYDTSHPAKLILGMSNSFRFERAWRNAIWHALRYAAGVLPHSIYSRKSANAFIVSLMRLKKLCTMLKSKLSDEFSRIVRMQTPWYQK
ncbi:MAG: hypothetical protein ACR5LF_11230 [Symbiopectobacterium sp.]